MSIIRQLLSIKLRLISLALITMPVWAGFHTHVKVATAVRSDFETALVRIEVREFGDKYVGFAPSEPLNPRSALLWRSACIESSRRALTSDPNVYWQHTPGRSERERFSPGSRHLIRLDRNDVVVNHAPGVMLLSNRWVPWGGALIGLLLFWFVHGALLRTPAGEKTILARAGSELRVVAGLLLLFSFVVAVGTREPDFLVELYDGLGHGKARVEAVYYDPITDLNRAALRLFATEPADAVARWEKARASNRSNVDDGCLHLTVPPGLTVGVNGQFDVEFNHYGGRFVDYDYGAWVAVPLWLILIVVAIAMIGMGVCMTYLDRRLEKYSPQKNSWT